jgi:hypothetical protein
LPQYFFLRERENKILRYLLRAQGHSVILVADENEATLLTQMAESYLVDHRGLQVRELALCSVVELDKPRVEILHIHYN